MKRKLTVFITVLLMGLLCAVTAFAAPYQNYNYYKGLVSTEPQAYVPYKVIDAVSMGVQTNMDDGFKNPEDMDTSAVNGDMAIADTGNSRVVIIDKSYKLKQYISNKTVQTVQEPVLDEEGNPVLDENGQPTYTETTVEISGFEFNGKNYTLSSPSGVTFAKDGSLYICDTGNARIIRFEADENGQYVCVRIFEKPAGLDELLASDDNSGSISAEGKRPGRQLPETVVPNRAPSNPRPAEQAAGYDERNRKPGSVFEKKTAKRPTGATGSDIDAAKRPATGRIRGASPDRTASKRPDLPVRIVCRGEGAHAGFRKRKLTYKT